MYDRYKTKRSSTGTFKVLFFLVLTVLFLFFGYKYKRYLFFWKYSDNKLLKKIEAAEGLSVVKDRRSELTDLVSSFDQYKYDNQVTADAFFLSGMLHYKIAGTYLPGSFSELIINDKAGEVNEGAKAEFLMAIRDFKKGIALKEGGDVSPQYLLLLAKSCFYTGYCNIEEIYALIQSIDEPEKIRSVEDIRFYGIVYIQNNNVERGLSFLNQYGMVNDSIQGRLFKATAEKISKRYTASIMSYKDILQRTTDEKILKLVHVNLGKIYFNQSLFKESIAHFDMALRIDEKDNQPKIWIGKNYSAMGDKDKAKAIWSEVLTSDEDNREVKDLLGIM